MINTRMLSRGCGKGLPERKQKKRRRNGFTAEGLDISPLPDQNFSRDAKTPGRIVPVVIADLLTAHSNLFRYSSTENRYYCLLAIAAPGPARIEAPVPGHSCPKHESW